MFWPVRRGEGVIRVDRSGAVAAVAKRGYCDDLLDECGNGVVVLREREPIREWRRVRWTTASRRLDWHKVHQDVDWIGKEQRL